MIRWPLPPKDSRVPHCPRQLPTLSAIFRSDPSISRVKTSVVADKASLQPSTAQTSKELVSKKKDEIVPELTPLEKMLQNAGPLREDATDKFFGFENVC